MVRRSMFEQLQLLVKVKKTVQRRCREWPSFAYSERAKQRYAENDIGKQKRCIRWKLRLPIDPGYLITSLHRSFATSTAQEIVAVSEGTSLLYQRQELLRSASQRAIMVGALMW